MKLYVLLGEISYEDSFVLGVYSSFEEACNAYGVYTRDDTNSWEFDAYCVVEKALGAPAECEWDPKYIEVNHSKVTLALRPCEGASEGLAD